MLVLSRRRNQQIVFGDKIVLTVVSVRGQRVRLDIDAPREVAVRRKEIYDAARKEQAVWRLKEPLGDLRRCHHTGQ
ncbi:MAG TPA: carbon storage regulator [Planctomycetaceae bacterium]|nr:carbon storage regulator [Planctomycetaceae bacterium]HIQ21898.1 carbon storage regulator [Planctomycetota bacterium]